MYCMTGRWPEGSSSEQAATGSDTGGKQPTGLRASLRRLWRPASSAPATATPATATPATAVLAGDPGAAGQEAGAGQAGLAAPANANVDTHVPGLLQTTAAWSWRLLLTGLVIYLAFRLAVFLRLVTLPFIAAMLATALLQPFAAWLRRRGFSPLLSTWCTFFLALVVIAGAITLLANQISSQYPVLFDEVQKTANQLQHSLAGRPVPCQSGSAV